MPSVLPTANTSVGSCSLIKHIDDAAYSLDESVGEIGNEDSWIESSKSHTLFILIVSTHLFRLTNQHSNKMKKKKERKKGNKREGVMTIGGGDKDVENRMDDGKVVYVW
jgi:hypothetical protein